MDANPIPEHLDAFHPILQNSSSGPTTPEHSPNPQPAPQLPQQLPPPPQFMHHHAPFFSPLFRFDVKPPTLPFFNNNANKAEPPLSPQDLTKPKKEIKKEEKEEVEEEEEEEEEQRSPKLVPEDEPREEERSDKNSTRDEEDQEELEPENDDEEQPENLSSKSLPLMYPLPLLVSFLSL
jgi:hypothetical protein